MSVAGFDIGSQTSTVAVARKRGIDVLLNKESNRETPSLVRDNITHVRLRPFSIMYRFV